MPPHADKNARINDQTRTARSVPADPKSFSPHVSDAAAPNAWESLRALTGKAPRTSVPGSELLALARSNIKARKLRYNHLPATTFGEPAWDMLLLLYVSIRSGTRESVSTLSVSAGAAATTALRWIDYLIRHDLAIRQPSRRDLRVVFIEISDKGRAAVEAYLTDLLNLEAASPGVSDA